MKKTSVIVVLCFLCGWVQAQIEKSDLKILYVGGSSDLETVVTEVDSAVLALSVAERMDAFEKMLKGYFETVKVVLGDDYKVEMSELYDVTVFDGKLPELEPAHTEKDAKGRFISRTAARYLPDDFDRPAVMLAEMGETLGRRIGLKADWYCLCLDSDAHSFRADHPIFKGPFPVKMTLRMEPTPEAALHYDYLMEEPLPDSVLMWRVQNWPDKKGNRIGMVSRPWGFEDSPEAEYISSGVCAKSLDAVAIGRHGNFFHWGFAASPKYMTDEAKTVLANAIVYIAQFAGQTPIARKFEDGIATRGYIREKKYYATRKAWEDRLQSDKEFAAYMLAEKKKAEEKQQRGETLTKNDKRYLGYKPQPSLSYEDLLKRFQKELFDVFGTDERAYLRYYNENHDYFYGGEGFYNLEVDEDAKSLGISNHELAFLDTAIRLWETGKDVAKARRILNRYTLCRFSNVEEWRNWFEDNKERLFFTESGGWIFMVNTRDKSIPGNDYRVRNKMQDAGMASSDGQTGKLVTDTKNPVRMSLNVEQNDNGNKTIVVRVKIHAGYHIYAQVAESEPFIPTTLTFVLPAGYEMTGEMQLPPFKAFNSVGTTVYENEVVFRKEIKGGGSGEVKCVVRYQCCDAHICFPPAEEVLTVKIE